MTTPRLSTLARRSSCRYLHSPAAPARQKLLGRYSSFPCDLARVQSGSTTKLRDHASQIALKRFSYDLTLREGQVWPAMGDHFIGTWSPSWVGEVDHIVFKVQMDVH